MFRRGFLPFAHPAKSPPNPRAFSALTVNMTSAQGSLPQINQGEIAVNSAFSAAWGEEAQLSARG
jgi:hypothetical protein